MMTSAPISRASDTGRLSRRPPSTSMRSWITTGAKTPGSDIEARIAMPRLTSFCSTTRSPETRSVAMAPNGMASSVRSFT